jgi:hypothetical protein
VYEFMLATGFQLGTSLSTMLRLAYLTARCSPARSILYELGLLELLVLVLTSYMFFDFEDVNKNSVIERYMGSGYRRGWTLSIICVRTCSYTILGSQRCLMISVLESIELLLRSSAHLHNGLYGRE